MKKLFILAMAFGLAACSTDKTEMPEVGSLGDVETNYLTVNLVATPATRAENTGDPDNAKYEDGSADENSVNAIRFYFFDGTGDSAQAVSVKKDAVSGQKVSYLDWENDDIKPGAGTAPNVEKIIAADLVINTEEGDGIPSAIIAVLNPTTTLKAATISSISDLNAQVEAYATTGAANSFVMSNSVYANGTTKMEAVDVSANLRSSADAAKAAPAIIYVERVVAKTSLDVDLEPAGDTEGVYATASEDKEYKFGDQTIYVKFLGWNVTAAADKSYLMKEINAGWADNLFGAQKWNWAPYFRSYWAVNPSGINYTYGTFNKSDDAMAADVKEIGESTYLRENASDNKTTGANPTTPTQVIIAAQLCDEDGNAIEFAEYGSQQFLLNAAKEGDVTLLDNYANIAGIYVKSTTEGEEKYEKITSSVLTLKTATQVGKADKNTPGRYNTYAQIDATEETLADLHLTIGNAKGSEELSGAAGLARLNEILINLGPAKVWEEGHTYYYFDIAHLGTVTPAAEEGGEPTYGPGSLGVVRNHVYKSTITKLVGLGTPVYDPDEVIYPEKPKNEYTFLAAEIRILSWRIVNHDIELDWE